MEASPYHRHLSGALFPRVAHDWGRKYNDHFSLSSWWRLGYVVAMKLFKATLVTVSSLILLAPPAFAQENNTLTDAEKAAGWQLLFDGKTFNGWHNFKKDGVATGWEIQDGAMVDVQHGGDIVTSNQFDWFELELDYKISEDGNSGIMFHVTDTGPTIWATGPEFQLEDNSTAADPWRCGWLYDLYKPPVDSATGKPIDATKPANQWNHVRLVIAPPPAKCEHYINGVKYFDYVLHSDDFNARLAKSKFAHMAFTKDFAKSDIGFIGLQGDHPGAVSFRNIKIRIIKP